jgi:MFS transporter, ACS family, tartrate transporter
MSAVDDLDVKTLTKVSWRLLPFLFVLYITSYLDRVNVGFAALQMNSDLKFSSSAFGLGSGIFFIGYCLFEVPSNLILARVGARLWIARIMVTWGLLASAMMFVRTPASFYGLRFALGVAEAGFFPGIIYYLSQWYPAPTRGRAIALFMTGIPFSGIVGGPLSGALLGLNGKLGLAGWQWLFLIEGLPSILLGVLVLVYLADTPDQAKWLEPQQRQALTHSVRQSSLGGDDPHANVGRSLLSSRLWLLGIALFLVNSGLYGYLIWSPQVIKQLSGAGNFGVGLISAGISALMAVAMVINAIHSDQRRERRWHSVLPLIVMGFGFFVSVLEISAPWALAGLALIPIGIGSLYGPFWSYICASQTGAAGAAAIALVASIGNAGGMFGPMLIGVLKDRTGSYQVSFVVLAIVAIAAAALMAWTMRLAKN